MKHAELSTLKRYTLPVIAMRPRTFFRLVLLMALATVSLTARTAFAGSLTPASPAAPSMFTLQDIWNRLTNDSLTTSGSHNLSTTTSPVGTMHTLSEIYAAIPRIFASDFLSSSTYLGVTGSIVIHSGDTTASSSSVSSNKLIFVPPKGYYDGTATVSATDPNLDPVNVKSGVNILGIVGTDPGSGGGGSPPPANKRPLATNQTLCYDASGAVIACAGTFQDGDLLKGTARSYTDNGDGTVSDNSTGLMWMQCTQGRSGAGCAAGSATTMSWDVATSSCTGMTFAGHSDWRLPNISELLTIADYSTSTPAINSVYFPNSSSTPYWTSSPELRQRFTWVVTFDWGESNYEVDSSLYVVRCVRSQASPPSLAPAEPAITGIFTCYSVVSPYNEIPCAGTSQDGDSQNGAARSFTDNGDGTVTDNGTGLMWQKCPVGLIDTYCDNYAAYHFGSFDWPSALTVCSTSTIGGYHDWRLPNIAELSSLIEWGFYPPGSGSGVSADIDENYFPNTDSGQEISGTTNPSSPTAEFIVSGGVISWVSKSFLNQVRCVRN